MAMTALARLRKWLQLNNWSIRYKLIIHFLLISIVPSLCIALLMAWVGDSLVRREFKQAALRCAIAMLPIVGWQAYVAEVQAGASYAAPAYSYSAPTTSSTTSATGPI